MYMQKWQDYIEDTGCYVAILIGSMTVSFGLGLGIGGLWILIL